MNLRRWLHEHSLKLLAIRDTPEAIAGGVAIGLFFGFVPLLGLKTLSAILLAWLTRSNILAAIIAGTLHDVFLPFMPVIYRWEYDVGYWLLSNPHEWPPSMRKMNWSPHAWLSWTTFITVGRPLLVGSAVCSAPVAALGYFIAKAIVVRHHRKRESQSAPPDQKDPGKSQDQDI